MRVNLGNQEWICLSAVKGGHKKADKREEADARGKFRGRMPCAKEFEGKTKQAQGEPRGPFCTRSSRPLFSCSN